MVAGSFCKPESLASLNPTPSWLLLDPPSVAGYLSPPQPGLPSLGLSLADCPLPASLHPPRAPGCPIDAVSPPISPPSIDVSLDLQPTIDARIEEPAAVEALTPKLRLAIAIEVLHHPEMVEKSMSLSTEELDFFEFLVAQIASLSSSLACEDAIFESSSSPPVACEVMDLQSDLIVPSTNPLPRA
jgi:hypothetical protein